MGRRHSLPAGLLGLSVLIAGCATNRPANPFASKTGKSSSTQKSKTNAAADKALAQRQKEYASQSAADAGVAAAAGSSVAADDALPAAGHDPLTTAYIDQELRDATPEERANYMTMLEGKDSETVRQALYNRRVTMRADQKRLAAAPPVGGGRGAIQSTGANASFTGGSSRSLNAGEGMGNVNAWPRQGRAANPSPPTIMTSGSAGDVNAAQYDSPAQQGSGPPLLGHSSGYHGDLDADAAPGAGFAVVRPGTVPPGRVTVAGDVISQLDGGVPPGGTIPSGPARSAGGKAPMVAVGAPMSASPAPPRGTGAALGANITAEGGARDQLARYIATVESEAFELQPGETESERQAYLEKQVHLRMLYLMSGQQERALQAIPGLEPADQEFWQHTFWGLADYFDVNSMPASADRAAQTVTQLTNAVLRLQEKARLELRNVTFCHKISSFGNYEKYPRDEFSPGQEVLLYAEVGNTHSESTADGKFKTSLKSTLEIYRHGTQSELIDRIELPVTDDVCRTHRRDYFHSYQFTIPAKLALGPHVLKLTVEDQLSRRVGTYTLNFMVR